MNTVGRTSKSFGSVLGFQTERKEYIRLYRQMYFLMKKINNNKAGNNTY